jgi:hypothetical protein
MGGLAFVSFGEACKRMIDLSGRDTTSRAALLKEGRRLVTRTYDTIVSGPPETFPDQSD